VLLLRLVLPLLAGPMLQQQWQQRCCQGGIKTAAQQQQ
jgi:hypothetical protein